MCELESPWVLFVLIKQQLYGTLDTLDQTPSHYWNITLPRAQGLQPLMRLHVKGVCVCVCAQAECINVCEVCDDARVQPWIVLCVFTHSVVRGLTVPSQYTVYVCSLSAGVPIDPRPAGRISGYVKASCLFATQPQNISTCCWRKMLLRRIHQGRKCIYFTQLADIGTYLFELRKTKVAKFNTLLRTDEVNSQMHIWAQMCWHYFAQRTYWWQH